jgi:hypothetical protein
MSPCRLGIWSIGCTVGMGKAARWNGVAKYDEGAKQVPLGSQPAPSNLVQSCSKKDRHPTEQLEALSLKHGAQTGQRTLTIHWQRTPSSYIGEMLLYCRHDSTSDRTAPRLANAKINSRRQCPVGQVYGRHEHVLYSSSPKKTLTGSQPSPQTLNLSLRLLNFSISSDVNSHPSSSKFFSILDFVTDLGITLVSR